MAKSEASGKFDPAIATLTPLDNWRHRTIGMTCATCMYFVPKVKSDGSISQLGRCRNNPPSIRGFPVVFTSDWCGHHKLDENKIG